MTKKPNIIFITSDQQRADCYGFAGRNIKTPHLDQLANTGTRFDSCIQLKHIVSQLKIIETSLRESLKDKTIDHETRNRLPCTDISVFLALFQPKNSDDMVADTISVFCFIIIIIIIIKM